MKNNAPRFLQWLPAVTMVVAVIAGYVQLSEAVKSNSRSIEKQAAAMERITELLITDKAHDVQIATLRRDVDAVRASLDRHIEGEMSR